MRRTNLSFRQRKEIFNLKAGSDLADFLPSLTNFSFSVLGIPIQIVSLIFALKIGAKARMESGISVLPEFIIASDVQGSEPPRPYPMNPSIRW